MNLTEAYLTNSTSADGTVVLFYFRSSIKSSKRHSLTVDLHNKVVVVIVKINSTHIVYSKFRLVRNSEFLTVQS